MAGNGRGPAQAPPALSSDELVELAEFDRAGDLIASGEMVRLDPEPEVLSELREWPTPAPAMFSGLAGEIVGALAPTTEADPVALAAHLLVGVGSAADRTAHCAVGANRHYLNENMLLIGPTSAGRKGTAKKEIDGLFEEADDHWAAHCIASGLSTGEGLIFHTRDASTAPARGKGRAGPGKAEAVADSGVADKRLLVIEQEFASVLRVMRREGSTLSQVIRQAWDGGRLSTLTRSNSLVATGAHISIIGHITEAELRRDLDTTDLGNGLVNRFVLLLVRRAQMLPDGGHLPDETRRALGQKLRRVLDFARRTGQLQRDTDAAARWRAVYPDLSTPPSGLLGAVTSRAEAHVLRLSGLYAVLDLSPVVRLVHLEAALAFWEYAAASAAYVFGQALGDPVADKILAFLRSHPEGVSRTDISGCLGRNVDKKDIDGALSALMARSLANRATVSTGGRPKEWWTLLSSSFVGGEVQSEDTNTTKRDERNERNHSLLPTGVLPRVRTNNKEVPPSSVPESQNIAHAEAGPGLEPATAEYLAHLEREAVA